MNTGTKILIACVAGAGIGTAVGLELGKYLWWVGAIVGAAVGYLAYDFKAVISACRRSWRDLRNTKPDWKTIRLRTMSQLIGILIITCVVVYAMFLNQFVFPIAEREDPGFLFHTFLYYPAGFMGMLLTMIAAILLFGHCTNPKFCHLTHDQWSEHVKGMKTAAFWVSPFGLAYLIVICAYGILRFLWYVAVEFVALLRVTPSAIWRSSKFLCRFTKKVFITIHSECRVLCAVDACLGAMIGLWLGSALLGAIAGGLLGVANYHLVSIKWLKLKPA